MGRRRCAFTQAEVARALRAAERVAPGKMAVEIAPGGVIQIVACPSPQSTDDPVTPPPSCPPKKDWRL
jgi:hypothetical protein